MLIGTPWKLERFFLWHSISQLVVKIIAQNKNWGVRCNHTKAPWKVQSWCPLSSIKKLCKIFFSSKTMNIHKRLNFNLRNLRRVQFTYSTKIKMKFGTHRSTLHSDAFLTVWNVERSSRLKRSRKREEKENEYRKAN